MNTKNKDNKQVDLELIAQGVRMILEGIGEDPERAGLQETPQRVAEMYAELTSGMREDPQQHVLPLPGDKHDEMVIERHQYRVVVRTSSRSVRRPLPHRLYSQGRTHSWDLEARANCGNVFTTPATSGAIDDGHRKHAFRRSQAARCDGRD